MESVRTQRRPRQHTVLNIGREFNLAQDQWKELADRIESIISGQKSFFPSSDEIERLAKRYANKIIRRQGQTEAGAVEEQDFQTVDINSLDNEQIRSVGGESVVLETIKELELDRKLKELGFNQPNIDAAIGVIAARLLAPASKLATHQWLLNRTSLDDLTNTFFEGSGKYNRKAHFGVSKEKRSDCPLVTPARHSIWHKDEQSKGERSAAGSCGF